MIRILKHGATEAEKTEADRRVRQTVETILEDVSARGDAAVRDLSLRFDKWEPAAFRLRPDEIRIADEQPARSGHHGHQIRPGADPSIRARAKGRPARYRGRNPPGHPPGSQEHPGQQRRLLRAGRAVSDGRLRPHVGADREGRGRETSRRLHAAAERGASRRYGRRHGAGRRG